MVFVKDGNMQIQKPVRYLEYIESTGTQWIDTGIVPNQDYAIEVKFQTMQSSACGILACDQNWQSNGLGIWAEVVEWGSATHNIVLYGNDPVEAALRNGVLSVNGDQVWSTPSVTFSCPVSLTVLCLNRNGVKQEFTAGKIYYTRIYNGNQLVQELLPAIDPKGIVCLYDLTEVAR